MELETKREEEDEKKVYAILISFISLWMKRNNMKNI